MAITAAQLWVAIGTTGADRTKDQINAVNNAVNEGSASIRSFAIGAAVVGAAALIGVGVASVKMASDFQSGVETLVTGAGESQKNIKGISDAILTMATQVGTSTSQLVAGMYQIESAGQRGGEALNTLKMAAEGAKEGNADLGTVAKATTAEMINYKDAHLTAAAAVNTLIATMGDGQTNIQDLSGAMAGVLPIASKAGVSLTDVSAAMATMTAKSVPAADASTYLRQTIMALDAPTSGAVSAMAAFGLKSSDVAAEMKKSLPDALHMITDAVGKKFPEGSAGYVAAISKIVGGTKSMEGIMNLTGADMNTFKGNVSDISSKVKEAGNSILNWSDKTSTFSFKMDQAKATLETLGIKIGTALLPALGRLLDGFSSPAFASFAQTIAGGITTALLGLINGMTTVVNVGANLVTFFEHNRVAAVALQVGAIALAGAIGGILVAAFAPAIAGATTVAIAFLGFAAPAIAAGIALAGVAALFIYLYNNVKPVHDAINALVPVFVSVWNILVSSFMPAWNQLVAAFQQALPAFKVVGEILVGVFVVALGIVIASVVALAKGIAASVGGIVQIFTGLVQILSGIFNVIGGIFIFLMDLITGRWTKLGQDLATIGMGIVDIFVGIWNVIAGVFNAAAGLIGGIVIEFITSIITFFTHLADDLVGHSIIPDMVNSIINCFQDLVQGAMNALQSLPGRLMSFWNGIVNDATTAGSNIGNGIANGIKGAIGAVVSAMSLVTSFISSHLPHSPAKIGPLTDLVLQGSLITEQLSQGMLSSLPKLQTAIGQLVKPISMQLSPGTNTSLIPSGISPISLQSLGNQGAVTVVVQSPSLYLNGQVLANGLMPYMTSAIRYGVGSRGM